MRFYKYVFLFLSIITRFNNASFYYLGAIFTEGASEKIDFEKDQLIYVTQFDTDDDSVGNTLFDNNWS